MQTERATEWMEVFRRRHEVTDTGLQGSLSQSVIHALIDRNMRADNMQADRAASVERSESNLSTDRRCVCVSEPVTALNVCEVRLKSGQSDTDTEKLRGLKKKKIVNASTPHPNF